MQYLHLEMLNRGIYFLHRGMFTVSTPMTEEVIDKAVGIFEASLQLLKPLADAMEDQ